MNNSFFDFFGNKGASIGKIVPFVSRLFSLNSIGIQTLEATAQGNTKTDLCLRSNGNLISYLYEAPRTPNRSVATGGLELQRFNPNETYSSSAYCNYVLFGANNSALDSSFGFCLGGLANYSVTTAGLPLMGGAKNLGASVGGFENGKSADSKNFQMGYGSGISGTTITNRVTFASGYFSTVGDAQTQFVTANWTTTSATPVTTTIAVNETDSTYAFRLLVAAKRQGSTNESAGYLITGVFDVNATSSTIALVGTPTVTVLGEDISAWDVSVGVTTAATWGLTLTATGEAAKNIRFQAVGKITQVKG